MSAPATIDQLVDLIRKSGVIDTRRLDSLVEKAGSAALPAEPPKFAALLVQKGVITRFQAEQLLLGKWRRFSIGNFKVLERLGSGGMGNVFLCEHKVMKHRVAIKVLATVIADDPAALKRFYREARAAAGLDHTNIVRAHDVGKDENLHYLVMDYVDGASLQEILQKYGPLDVLRSAHYIRQAARGLQYAHETGLIHRDIKPANLILDRSGVVKILDMGIALFAESDEEVLTRGPLGTADYLAPEQARDSHNVDARADIYSLGATFYTLLTGSLPFADAKTVSQKLVALQTKQPKPLRMLRPEVPEGLATIVEKMMAKDPAKRYQTVAEVIQELAAYTMKPIGPPPEQEMPRLSPALTAQTTITDSAETKENSKSKPAVPVQAKKNGNKLGVAAAVLVCVLAAVGFGVWWAFFRGAH